MKINLKQFEAKDTEELKPIFKDWVVDPETGEIDHDHIERIFILAQVKPELAGDKVYLVVTDESSKIIGFIGYKKPCDYMQSFCTTEGASEIINFYLSDHFKKNGMADKVLAVLETRVKNEGGEELVINRSPRYSNEVDSYFNDRKDYIAAGIAEDFFGEGFDTPVWVKVFK